MFKEFLLILEFLDTFLGFDEESIETLFLVKEFIFFVKFEVIALLQFVFEFVNLFGEFDNLKLLVG
jgi:hypothetical protein